MQSMMRHEGGGLGYVSIPTVADSAPTTPPLLEVLWRRRWTVALTMLACLTGAAIYLTAATPIYLASARVSIEQNAPKAFSDPTGYMAQSESFLPTQADAFLSTPVVKRALANVPYRSMKTFATVSDSDGAASWLRRSGALKTDVSRKSDVITVTMESPYPAEATEIVAAVVNAYIAETSQAKHATGNEIVRALQKQKDQILSKRDASLAGMLKLKQQSGVVSLKDDKSNTQLERMAALSTSLTQAEIATIELRAQQESVKGALADPASMASFVEAQQLKVRESGDREYDELRSQLGQAKLTLSSGQEMQGPKHPRVQALQSVIDSLKQRVTEKEVAMAKAQLLALSTQVIAAEDKEKQLRAVLTAQQNQALGLSPAVVEYAKLEAEATQLQKQLDVLDGRIAEVSVNTIETPPLNVSVMDPPRAEEKPLRPNKMLVMAAAVMAGCMLGMGLGLLREWQDSRLRRPEQIQALLGTAVIATVPRINMRLAPAIRGQIVHLDTQSPVAEAYRSVRTSLYLGSAREAKTVLVASPAPGDGKSTTASNLAIAFAQAGDRVLLIDCDLRQPVQHLIFELDGGVGLSSIMAGQVKLREAIRPTSVPGLHLLSGGPLPQNPSELLSGRKFKRLMQVLGNTFDRIVIDSPPLMRFNDGRILAASADVTLLVLRMNQSVRTLGTLALERLSSVGAKVLGAVANDVPAEGTQYYYYGRPWQYARPRDRALPNEAAAKSADKMLTNSNGNGNGNGHGNGNGGHHYEGRTEVARVTTSESLAISEVDWSSDAHE